MLRQWGPAHTLDDQTVHVDDRVLFGGDLFETNLFPILPYFPPFDVGFDSHRWLDALDRLSARPTDVVVPGHGAVSDVSTVRSVRQCLEDLVRRTREQWLAGTSRDEAARIITEDAQRRWPSWEGPRNVGHLVHALYDESTAGGAPPRTHGP